MHINLTLFPYLAPLLRVHQQTGQQPDNLCGPYWVSLLLQAYGHLEVTPVDVAIAAGTVVPSQGDPSSWLPSQAVSRLGTGYDRILTTPDAEASGTSMAGLMRATETLSHGRFCLLPLQTHDWHTGLAQLESLWHAQPDWQVVPLLNVHTQYFWGSKLTPLELYESFAEPSSQARSPADWSVGHFAVWVGQMQSRHLCLYTLLDTYPNFGWHGLHVQPPAAIATALQRPDHETQGGVGLFVASQWRSQVEDFLERSLAAHNFCQMPWDNGSPDGGACGHH